MKLFLVVSLLSGGMFSTAAALPENSRAQAERRGTALGVADSRFTLNGVLTFLLGFSYYGALGAPREFIHKDLDGFQTNGFNWLRVWATWASQEEDVSAVDAHGQAHQPFLGRLQWLVAECDRRGLVVDVTLTRGKPRLSDFNAHEQAVATLVKTLAPHRNWYLDLANERDVRDERYVSVSELQRLRELVRHLDPSRLVTASFGGHDLELEDVRGSLLTAGLDFLCPHRPRSRESPGQTEAQTRLYLSLMKQIGRVVPVHYQEPFRRGYTDWQPTAVDFLSDLRGAVAGGAAGWCFHNGQERNTPDNRPGRSFDLRRACLLDQLDPEERKVLTEAQKLLPGALRESSRERVFPGVTRPN